MIFSVNKQLITSHFMKTKHQYWCLVVINYFLRLVAQTLRCLYIILSVPLLFFHFQIIGKYTRYIHKYNSTADIYFHENFPWNHIHKNFPWNHFDKNWEIDFTKKITSKSTLPRPFCQKNCVNRRVEMFWLSITTRGEHTQNFWKSKACF